MIVAKASLLLVCLLLGLGHALDVVENCNAIPFNFITLCNMWCLACSISTVHQSCSSCPDYLVLDPETERCNPPVGEKYYSNIYFKKQKIHNTSDLAHFSTQNGILTDNDVLQLCIANTYRFQIAGLFNSQKILSFDQSYDFEVDFISISFRLFTSTSSAVLKVQINGAVAYIRELNVGASISITVDKNANPISTVIETDPSNYLDTIFTPIQTGMLPLNSKDAHIEITVITHDMFPGVNSAFEFWGFNEMVILGRECSKCVSDATKNLQRILGIIIGITAGLVIGLVIILLIVNSIKEADQKRKMKSRIEAMLKDKISQDKKARKHQQIEAEEPR